MAGCEPVEIRGERVILRDQRPSDVDSRLRWLTTETEWGEWDAPWEGNEPLPAARIEQVRARMMENMAADLPIPRTMLYIELIGGPLLGWVSQYVREEGEPRVFVGIDICESSYWGQGLGAEALALWLDYLFANLDIESVRMSTWSGNERMIHCGRKCAFVLEERIAGARQVRGESYDAVTFRLMRTEWEAHRATRPDPKAT